MLLCLLLIWPLSSRHHLPPTQPRSLHKLTAPFPILSNTHTSLLPALLQPGPRSRWERQSRNRGKRWITKQGAPGMHTHAPALHISCTHVPASAASRANAEPCRGGRLAAPSLMALHWVLVPRFLGGSSSLPPVSRSNQSSIIQFLCQLQKELTLFKNHCYMSLILRLPVLSSSLPQLHNVAKALSRDRIIDLQRGKESQWLMLVSGD